MGGAGLAGDGGAEGVSLAAFGLVAISPQGRNFRQLHAIPLLFLRERAINSIHAS